MEIKVSDKTVTVRCDECGSADVYPEGKKVNGAEYYQCRNCGNVFGIVAEDGHIYMVNDNSISKVI